MNVIDRSMSIKSGDNVYRIIFTIKSIISCERELENKNIIMTLAKMERGVLSLGDTYAMLRWGLWGDKKYTEAEIDSIFAQCLDDPGVVGIQRAVVEALTKSGFLGKNIAALL